MRIKWILLGTVVSAVVGCQTPEAPPVSGVETEPGKRIFYGKCAVCHVPEPIDNYSPQQWREIVEDMAPRANLSPAEKNALMRYILSGSEALLSDSEQEDESDRFL